ncbi:uncharacterized protein LOC143922647 isoform X1 [Arctopsyche grandis]|uniref:uncharacterized protein LOC143922647 isoform X1 n=2 Tax=Arctopsyche grandis TaxID=121162 RepID=UPI00406D8E67
MNLLHLIYINKSFLSSFSFLLMKLDDDIHIVLDLLGSRVVLVRAASSASRTCDVTVTGCTVSFEDSMVDLLSLHTVNWLCTLSAFLSVVQLDVRSLRLEDSGSWIFR